MNEKHPYLDALLLTLKFQEQKMLNALGKKNGSPIKLQGTDWDQWHSSLEILEKKQFKVDAIYCQTVK